jgi:type I restriction enzyme, S subunit
LSEWQIKKIKDVTVKVGSGSTPRGGQSVYIENGCTLIRSQNVYDFKFEKDGLVFIGEEHAEKLKSVTLQKNDILLNITGDSVGRCCIVPSELLPARVNQHVAIIRTNNDNNPKFLMYYLNDPSNKERLLNQVHGGTRKALTKGIIEEFEIKVPSLEEQNQIVSILDSLDQKIELNLKMNETLEMTVRTLYKNWFVDCEPFKNEEFEETKFGKIPNGWKMVSLDDYCNLITDGAHASPREFPNDKFIATVKDIEEYSFNNSTFKSISDEDFEKLVAGNCQPIKGDVLLSKDGTIGKVLYISETLKNVVLLSSIAILRPKFSSYYLYTYLRDPLNKEMIVNGYVSGSALTRLVLKSIKNIPILLPTDEVLNEFDNKVENLIEQISANQEENIYLIKTRDYLIKKLLSGDIELSNEIKGEKIVTI